MDSSCHKIELEMNQMLNATPTELGGLDEYNSHYNHFTPTELIRFCFSQGVCPIFIPLSDA